MVIETFASLVAKMSEMRLLLFGDGAFINHAHLRSQFLESRGNPFLSLLFQKCSDILRNEVAQLSPVERRDFPVFNSIDELNERTKSSRAHAGVQNALLCTSQLAHYIE